MRGAGRDGGAALMSGDLTLQLRITGDASGLKASVVDANTAVGTIGPTAQTSATTAATALGKIGPTAQAGAAQAVTAVGKIGPAAQTSATQAAAAIGRIGPTVQTSGAQVVAVLNTLRGGQQAAALTSATLGRQSGITANQMRQLAPQINDVVTTLAMGARPMQVAIQQGGQITQIFGGVGPTLRAFATTLGAGNIAALALGGTVALLAAKGAALQVQQRELTVALTGTGRAAEVTTGQLQAYIRQLERAGASDAQGIVAGLARTQGLSGGDIGRIVGLAPGLAAVQGTGIGDAAQQLASAFTSGYAGIKKLDDALQFLTATEREQVQTMLQHGQRADALRLASDRLATQLGGADKAAVGDITKAFREMGSAWSDFTTELAKSSYVQAFLTVIAGSAKLAAEAIKGITPAVTAQAQLAQALTDKARAEQALKVAPAAAIPFLQKQLDDANRRLSALGHADADQHAVQMLLGGPITGGAATSPGDNGGANEASRQKKLVDDLTQSYRDQQRVLAVGIAQRPAMIAQIAAEHEAEANGITGKQREELIRRRVAEAVNSEAAARAQDVQGMTAETAAAMSAVAASEQGRAAMLRASAAAQAHGQAAQQAGVNESALARAILNRQAAQTATSGAEQALQLEEQATAAERIAAAMRNGFQAEHVAEVGEQVRQLTAQLRAAAEATDDPRLKSLLTGLSGRIGSAVQRTDAATQDQQLSGMILAQRQNLETLRLQSSFAGFGGSQADQAKALADLQAVHDLERSKLDITSEQARVYRDQAQAIASTTLTVQRQQDAWREVGQVGQQIANDIANGQIGFKTLEKVGLSVAQTLIQKFAELAIVNPLMNAIGLGGGGLPSFGDLFGGGGGSSFGGAMEPFAIGSIYHAGGIAGGRAPGRAVPIGLFAGAPRLHGGGFIGAGEVPAILRAGEGVFTPEQMAAMGGGRGTSVTINFSGDAGNPADRRRLSMMVQQAADAAVVRRMPAIAASSNASLLGQVKQGGAAARALGVR
jgi:hypothetical protein